MLISYHIADYFTDDWRLHSFALSRVNGMWVWDKNISDPLDYNKWAEGQPSSDGDCGSFSGLVVEFGFNDYSCASLNGYICEDIHCYLL